MKTEEGLKSLKEELETFNNKLTELSEDELVEITGGEGMDSWLERMKKKMEDYYSNTKPSIKEQSSNLLPDIDPDVLDKIIDKD